MTDKYRDIIVEQWRLYPDIMRSYTGRAGPEPPHEPPKLPEPEPELKPQKIGDNSTMTTSQKCCKIIFAPLRALIWCFALLKFYSTYEEKQ